MTTMGDCEANELVDQWLGRFCAALGRGDVPAVTALFAAEECFWRDLAAWTWNIKTLEGRAAIAEMLRVRLADTLPFSAVRLADAQCVDGIVEAGLSIEKLSRTHRVDDFDCGKEALNKFLSRFALGNQQANASQTYVACESERVIGYYTLVFGQVTFDDAPQRLAAVQRDEAPRGPVGKRAERPEREPGAARGAHDRRVLEAPVVAARAERRVTLYTGNDDHIVLDLLVPYAVQRGQEQVEVRIRGGLLGHWSVWTRSAVQQLQQIQRAIANGAIAPALLALDSRVTDCNAAFFDVANNFAGCIAGCHEVLRRQGLLEGIWCLDPNETLSPGQREEIDRVCREHADLADDAFVAAGLARWLA